MREKIRELIAQFLGLEVSDIENEARLAEDLGLEGSQLSDLLNVIREQLNIEVPTQDLSGIETVGEFAELVEQHAQEEI